MPNSGAEVPITRRTLPETAQLLVAGGDARIALDPVSGLNKYGCRPVPDAALLSFGSSTASTVSQVGFLAADRLRERLPAGDWADEMQRIREELLSDVSDLGIELVFASSGTDAHAIAAGYSAVAGEPLAVVMVEEAETGSGVAAALDGLASHARSVAMVPLRADDGEPRQIAVIDADVVESVSRAVSQGARVLLVMVDQSKTGLMAPSPSCVMELYRLYSGKLNVLVDACQFRIGTPTLRAYLQQGFMVALTGSKFLTGPSFSAALLLPDGLAQSAALKTMQGRLAGRDDEFERAGGLLRWEAALAEWRRFRALPSNAIVECLQIFAGAVQQRLKNDPRFEPLAVLPLDRSPLLKAQGWDCLQTIFPFLLYRIEPGVARIPLNREETQRVYRQLQLDMSESVGGESAVDIHGMVALRCQFGQPVACGVRHGVAVSALRLCISARLISDAIEQNAIARIVDEALAALDKTAWLIDCAE